MMLSSPWHERGTRYAPLHLAQDITPDETQMIFRGDLHQTALHAPYPAGLRMPGGRGSRTAWPLTSYSRCCRSTPHARPAVA